MKVNLILRRDILQFVIILRNLSSKINTGLQDIF